MGFRILMRSFGRIPFTPSSDTRGALKHGALGCRKPPLICARSHQCHWTQLVSLREHQSVCSGRPVTNSNGYHFKYVGPPLSSSRCTLTPAQIGGMGSTVGLTSLIKFSNELFATRGHSDGNAMLLNISCHAENSACQKKSGEKVRS